MILPHNNTYQPCHYNYTVYNSEALFSGTDIKTGMNSICLVNLHCHSVPWKQWPFSRLQIRSRPYQTFTTSFQNSIKRETNVEELFLNVNSCKDFNKVPMQAGWWNPQGQGKTNGCLIQIVISFWSMAASCLSPSKKKIKLVVTLGWERVWNIRVTTRKTQWRIRRVRQRPLSSWTATFPCWNGQETGCDQCLNTTENWGLQIDQQC